MQGSQGRARRATARVPTLLHTTPALTMTWLTYATAKAIQAVREGMKGDQGRLEGPDEAGAGKAWMSLPVIPRDAVTIGVRAGTMRCQVENDSQDNP